MAYSKLQTERKNKGLCICGAKSASGKVLCKSCAIKHSQKSMKLRAYRKENKLCYYCGTKIVDSFAYCSDCRKKVAKSVKSLVKKRQAKGLCHCGDKATIGKICEKCWFKHASLLNTGSRKNWEAIKNKLEAQQYRCVYTQELLVPGKNASLDHIIPKIKGGSNNIENLQWTTNFINTKMKCHFTHNEFISLIKNIIKNTQSLSL